MGWSTSFISLPIRSRSLVWKLLKSSCQLSGLTWNNLFCGSNFWGDLWSHLLRPYKLSHGKHYEQPDSALRYYSIRYLELGVIMLCEFKIALQVGQRLRVVGLVWCSSWPYRSWLLCPSCRCFMELSFLLRLVWHLSSNIFFRWESEDMLLEYTCQCKQMHMRLLDLCMFESVLGWYIWEYIESIHNHNNDIKEPTPTSIKNLVPVKCS